MIYSFNSVELSSIYCIVIRFVEIELILYALEPMDHTSLVQIKPFVEIIFPFDHNLGRYARFELYLLEEELEEF